MAHFHLAINPYPLPTHNYKLNGDFTEEFKNSLPSATTLQQIFSHLPEPDKSNDYSHKYYSQAKYMGKHCQGQNEIKLDDIGPTIRSEHHGNIEFRRLSLKNGGQYKKEIKKGKVERRLTPRECALIQTFPDDFDFVIPDNSNSKKKYSLSVSQGYKVVGNAVPPLLAYHLAKRIEKLWDIYFKK